MGSAEGQLCDSCRTSRHGQAWVGQFCVPLWILRAARSPLCVQPRGAMLLLIDPGLFITDLSAMIPDIKFPTSIPAMKMD